LRIPPKPPQPRPRPRPRKGRVLHAQSAFRTYICSNLNLCTLPMSLSHKKELQQYFQCVTKKRTKNYRRTKNKRRRQQKEKKKSKVCGASSNSNTICINVHNRHDFYFIVSPSSQITSIITTTKKKKTSKISYYRHNYQQTLVAPSLWPSERGLLASKAVVVALHKKNYL